MKFCAFVAAFAALASVCQGRTALRTGRSRAQALRAEDEENPCPGGHSLHGNPTLDEYELVVMGLYRGQ